MADKVEKTAPLSLAVEAEKKMMKPARAAPPLLAGVRGVILRTLLDAGIFPVSWVVATAFIAMRHPPSSWLLPHAMEMTTTGAEETVAVALALIAWMLWCAAPQAAAAAVALMLPRHCRRLRLLLAYAALVAQTAGHSMFAGLLRTFFGAGPGGVVRFVTTATIFIVGVGDILCLLGLIVRGGEE